MDKIVSVFHTSFHQAGIKILRNIQSEILYYLS